MPFKALSLSMVVITVITVWGDEKRRSVKQTLSYCLTVSLSVYLGPCNCQLNNFVLSLPSPPAFLPWLL